MRRKFVCKTCQTSKNSATGKTLYILGDTTGLEVQPRMSECWDCGEKRRAEEDKKRKKNPRIMEEENVAA